VRIWFVLTTRKAAVTRTALADGFDVAAIMEEEN
jgi:hypothetical protein